jgi:hypothetical protein
VKCVGCGIETSFEWPGGDDTKVKALWEAVYEGPLCKVCSGESPMRALADGPEPSQEFCHALRRRQKVDSGLLEFGRVLRLSATGGDDSTGLDEVEDL